MFIARVGNVIYHKGENMKTKEKIIILKQREEGALIKISVLGACVYAIYLKNGRDRAMETVGEDGERAEWIFEQVVKGELSPIHLRDYISDKALEVQLFK